MDEEEPTRKTSLRRFLRGSDKKGSPAKSSKGIPDAGLASSSSFPSGQNNLQLKGTTSAQATPQATPPHKKHHFGLLLRKKDLHLHNFFNRQNPQNSRRFSPPTEQSPLSVEASPTPAEAELSRALNQLNSVTRSGRLASSSSSGGFHTNFLGKNIF